MVNFTLHLIRAFPHIRSDAHNILPWRRCFSRFPPNIYLPSCARKKRATRKKSFIMFLEFMPNRNYLFYIPLILWSRTAVCGKSVESPSGKNPSKTESESRISAFHNRFYRLRMETYLQASWEIFLSLKGFWICILLIYKNTLFITLTWKTLMK